MALRRSLIEIGSPEFWCKNGLISSRSGTRKVTGFESNADGEGWSLGGEG